MGEVVPAIPVVGIVGGLQGDHHGLVADLPFICLCPDLLHCPGKLMPKGNLGQYGLVSLVIEPSVKIGSANSAMGNLEEDFAFIRLGNR